MFYKNTTKSCFSVDNNLEQTEVFKQFPNYIYNTDTSKSHYSQIKDTINGGMFRVRDYHMHVAALAVYGN